MVSSSSSAVFPSKMWTIDRGMIPVNIGDDIITEVFICTAVQIILWLFAQVHCRAAFTLSSRLPLFVYTLQLSVLYVAGGDTMLNGEDEGETNTNSLVVQ